MPSGTFYPAVSGDDGYTYAMGSEFDNTADYCRIGAGLFGMDYNSFFRFVSVAVAQGLTITSCILKVKCHVTSSVAISVNIYFVNADNPAAPISYVECGALSLTDAIAWSISTGWTAGVQYESPELKTILQPVIDRGGFASGNSIIAVIKDNGSVANRWRDISAIDYASGAYKVELYIAYSTPVVNYEVTLTPFICTTKMSLHITDAIKYLKLKKTADPYDTWDPEFTQQKEIIRTDCGDPFSFPIIPDYDLAPCDDPGYYFRVDPMRVPLLPSDYKTITVSGGVGPFTWEVEGDYFDVLYDETDERENTIFSTPETDGPADALVTVTDFCENERTGTIHWCAGDEGKGAGILVKTYDVFGLSDNSSNLYEHDGWALAAFDGKIYSCAEYCRLIEWDLEGNSAYKTPELQLDVGGSFIECVKRLVVIGDYLYGIGLYGSVFRWNGVDDWVTLIEGSVTTYTRGVLHCDVVNWGGAIWTVFYDGNDMASLVEWTVGTDDWQVVATSDIQNLLTQDCSISNEGIWMAGGDEHLWYYETNVDELILRATDTPWADATFSSIIYHEGAVYIGTGSDGIKTAGGTLIKWTGDEFVLVANRYGDETEINHLLSIGERLFASTSGNSVAGYRGKLLELVDGEWVLRADTGNHQVYAGRNLIVYNNRIYMSTGYNHIHLMRWGADDNWEEM